MLSGFTPRPLKRLFTANQCWTSFLDAGGLRDIEVEAVTNVTNGAIVIHTQRLKSDPGGNLLS